jgi:tripartite-type tricarboxylate transporter receptor subunit TctC
MMKARAVLLAALAVLLTVCGAGAADYPERTIHILVGFTPGVAPDVTSRLLGDKISRDFGQPVVVENVSGAGGNIACDRVAKAARDGYTLVMCGNGSLAIAPSLYEKLPYDPLKDLAPIVRVFVASNILTIHPSVPAKTLTEFVAYAKAHPGKLTYGHAGAGTSQHLAGELFKAMAHVDLRPVAYRGSTAVIPDLLAGRVDVFFGNIVNVVPLIRENKLRAFVVTSLKRSALVPELPTLDESGFPGFEAVPWFGLMAPAGTPQEIIDKLHDEVVRLLAMPDVREKLEHLGLDILGGTPAEFRAAIETETPRWAKLIKAAGIKINP